MFWETWSFAFGVTVPNLLILILGVWLRRTGLMDDNFNEKASRLVFNIALPCLLFFSVAQGHDTSGSNLPLAIYGAVGTVISFLLLECVAIKLVKDPRERGIFLQGGEGKGMGLQPILRGIVTNPLIIGLVLGLAFQHSHLPMPDTIGKTGEFISGMALPLAMLCAGASLDWRTMFRSSNVAAWSSASRVIFVPALMTLGGWMWGFRGAALGVIFLFSCTPTAAGSYVMTRALGGNATLAANIIAVTTIGSFFTTALGLYLLRALGVI